MWQSSRIHGIKNKDLIGQPTLIELWPKISTLLKGRALVAHACGTEKRFLRAFAGQTFEPWVDSLKLARAALPSLKKHSLGSLLPYLGDDFQHLPVNEGRQWHDALYDAAASFCFVKQLVHRLKIERETLSLLVNPSNQKYHSFRSQTDHLL